MKDERFARRALNCLPGVGPLTFPKLLARFGSAAKALAASRSEWGEIEGVGALEGFRLFDGLEEAARRVDDETEAMAELGARVLIDTDEEYPEGLKSIPDAPVVLHVIGDFQPVDSLAVALVGTRRPTAYGKAVAARLAADLASAGVTLVSGLARGIDTEVHAAAVKAGGRTIGILGSGFRRFYPPENKSLASKMAAKGAVVSEFPLTTAPDRGNFPRRNRIISALSLAVVVVEADEVSGALITARLAAEQGRDVFAVPGSVFSKYSRGPHRLLKQGARPVESAEDVLEEIEVFRGLLRAQKTAAAPVEAPAPLSTAEGSLLGHISLDPVGVDDLSVRTGWGPSALSTALLGLELKGLVRTLPGKNYVRTERGMAASAGR